MICPAHLVTSYILEVALEDSTVNITEPSTASSSGPAVSIGVNNLKEKATYSYSIVAINAIGRATTASTTFCKF